MFYWNGLVKSLATKHMNGLLDEIKDIWSWNDFKENLIACILWMLLECIEILVGFHEMKIIKA